MCSFPCLDLWITTLDVPNTNGHPYNNKKIKIMHSLDVHFHYELQVFAEGGHFSLILYKILVLINDSYAIISGRRESRKWGNVFPICYQNFLVTILLLQTMCTNSSSIMGSHTTFVIGKTQRGVIVQPWWMERRVTLKWEMD